MTYSPDTSDDYQRAGARDVPGVDREYTMDMGGQTEQRFHLPFDLKVMGLQNNTNQALQGYVSKYDGDTYTPDSLFPDATSSRVFSIAAGGYRPVAQDDEEFNTVTFLAGSAATGKVTATLGHGRGGAEDGGNGLHAVETKVIPPVEA